MKTCHTDAPSSQNLPCWWEFVSARLAKLWEIVVQIKNYYCCVWWLFSRVWAWTQYDGGECLHASPCCDERCNKAFQCTCPCWSLPVWSRDGLLPLMCWSGIAWMQIRFWSSVPSPSFIVSYILSCAEFFPVTMIAFEQRSSIKIDFGAHNWDKLLIQMVQHARAWSHLTKNKNPLCSLHHPMSCCLAHCTAWHQTSKLQPDMTSDSWAGPSPLSLPATPSYPEYYDTCWVDSLWSVQRCQSSAAGYWSRWRRFKCCKSNAAKWADRCGTLDHQHRLTGKTISDEFWKVGMWSQLSIFGTVCKDQHT